MRRIEYATLELARRAGLRICNTRLEKVGGKDVLMLQRFDRAWNADKKQYARFGLVSGLTVLDADDGYFGRDRWSYLLLADELRRWSINAGQDQKELYRRMVFNAMVTNNDDHPRNHALLRGNSGWRLSTANDLVPNPMLTQKRRDLALDVGRFGRAASLYNLLSRTEVFGIKPDEGKAEIDRMLSVVRGWKRHFTLHGVEQRSVEMLEQAMLPASFYRTEPPGAE
jgi:serine/threonine-protein kinase HipA